ncbi:MAG: glycosyltransferase family 39 protein, partial [Proteobacteria bacterium]|nr:glycosyltransferase family 39 protein [Pseudomonadota bacterium]
MMAPAIVFLQVLGCLGLGILVLRLTGVHNRLSAGEQYTWSFAIGFGFLGWLLFFAGIFGALSREVLLITIAAPVPAVALLRPTSLAKQISGDVKGSSWVVIGAVILVFAMDAIEVPAPATDADSIAYHFDLPRRFWEAGKVYFVPRALDGAAPLLVQMTYMVPYAFGGETALNLWTMFTGLAASLLVYTMCRRYLTPNWSFGILVVFATTPAVVYGAGSGQVEVKLAMFAIIAVMAVGEALRRNESGFVVVAGLAAGFFAGGKYFGLMFAVAVGLALLCKPGFVRRGAIYSVATIVAGFQWYWWNWLHTGDPVFPMLYPLLGDAGTG